MKSLFTLILAGLSAAAPAPTGHPSAVPVAAPSAPATLVAKNALSTYPGAALLGAGIEGCSVDAAGNMYAVNATHMISLSDSKVLLQGPGGGTSHFASSRFTRTYGTLVGDAAAHRLLVAATNTYFMTEAKMLQPNDFTVSRDESKIYLSGMNYSANTGDLWVYDVTTKTPVSVCLDGVKTFRMNGIELSPDDKTLYVTSAENGVPEGMAGASVYKFSIDSSGRPTKPVLAIDLYKELEKKGLDPKKAGMDPDGMRMDAKGTLFMTLNAFGRVLMWDTSKPACESQVIELDTISFPTNLELGGRDGKTLVVIGKCKADKTGTSSCVDSYQHTTPGRAWTNLQVSRRGGSYGYGA
ncbi:hypothetical protein FN846DRAFT_926000 [Sphaerosporella brunnea]|uniref:SMP-30/Gluconolactonase/LRE-like region domain-containing protein n=1 Tax=Sphaerosporella brunnea TaxID=1250544 RepID=A0A5J5FBC9_9PEZI|nr:hypothetical protein FN846DRAFT_926000 [Sphaerosporella brunnea]